MTDNPANHNVGSTAQYEPHGFYFVNTNSNKVIKVLYDKLIFLVVVHMITMKFNHDDIVQ